ncbi:hypothetical protein BS78_K151100 [Paspalum vaginatum]|uniref:Uncharacterized protein n=1 Tax=Paspalum vaginatum TaxID=158149 RepID=A0A9W7X8H8_9POAL|nr:hypothetical protein BS78_K151100 [Paspalum vaginatum]
MPTAVSAAAVLDLGAAIIAVECISFFDPRPGAGTAAPAPAPLLDGMFELLLPLAAGNGRLWRRFTVLCTATGALHLFFFVLQPAGGVGDVRALGLAAARALPVSAVACFFLGMVLIILAHIRAGGEGGGGAFGVADGQIRFLTRVAFGAAAAVVWLMAMAIYGVTSGSNCMYVP